MASTGNGFYGRGLSKSSIKSVLPEVEDQWNIQKGEINRAYENTYDELNKQYTQAASQAYSSKLLQERDIYGSNIVGAGRNALLENTELAYQQAYDSYRKSLEEGRAEITEQYIKNLQNMNTQMEERSQKFADYGESYYDYLTYLYDTYYGNRVQGESPWERVEFKQFLTEDLDDEGNAIIDEQGNPQYRLKTKDELYNSSYVDEELGKKYTSIYDEQGRITDFGKLYFDILENKSFEGVTGFQEWLTKENEELADWAFGQGNNIYDWSSDSTNAGTFRELTGRRSDDYTYTFIDNAMGLKEGSIREMFDGYINKFDDLSNKNLKDKGKEFVQTSKDILSEIKNIATDLGIGSDMEELTGYTWDELEIQMENAINQIKNGGEMAAQWFSGLGEGTDIGVSGVAGLAATGLAEIPIVGQILVGIASLGGIAYGFHKGSSDVNKQRKLNKQLSDNVKTKMDSLLRNMVDYSVARSRGYTLDEYKLGTLDYLKKYKEQELIKRENKRKQFTEKATQKIDRKVSPLIGVERKLTKDQISKILANQVK